MPVNSHLQRVTLLLAAASTTLVQIALESRDPEAGVALLGVSLALVFGTKLLVPKKDAEVWSLPEVVGVVAVSLLPIAWDLASRAWLGMGAPYEVQLAYVLRNAMLALAVRPQLPHATNHAVLASFFLTVFGYLWSSGPWLIALLIVYALLGTWWLLAAYWERLGGRFADSSESAIPVRPALAAIVSLVLLIALLLPITGGRLATTALRGFFPSSGGTDWNDPFAHGGVGDGDQMVAAKDQASSFGPVDTELFLESKMPSLYDSFNEFSEPKPVTKKKQFRAIPLAPSQTKQNHEKKGVTQQATREFSTVRQPTPHRHGLEDRLSAALLTVSGRTPLHLALETYDRWDGRSLIASAQATPVGTVLRSKDASGRRWLNLSISHPDHLFTASESSQVRVINLKTTRVPTPAGATGVTMTGLHDASMFKFAADGSLAMDVPFVPQLTIFEFRALLRDRSADPVLAREAPETGSDAVAVAVANLAAEWTEGVPPGWAQVEAIVARLHEGYTLDRDAMVPAEVDDSVEHFLLEQKRGPDYLFAASTAVLLRSLGYDTRVRSGFYANPRSRNRQSQLTPVLAEDAHFWVEVRTQNGLRLTKGEDPLPGVWVTVEPTPGYEVLYAPETLLAWLTRVSLTALAAIATQPVTATLTTLALVFLTLVRRQLLDGLLIGWWSIRSVAIKEADLARMTLRCLEWRAWVNRRRRPVGTPIGRWDALAAQDDFVTLASWALYGMGSAPPLPAPSARAACWRALRTRFLQQPASPSPNENANATEESACKP